MPCSLWNGVVQELHQSDAVTHAEDVSVYRHGSFVEHDGLNDIGRFAPYSRKSSVSL